MSGIPRTTTCSQIQALLEGVVLIAIGVGVAANLAGCGDDTHGRPFVPVSGVVTLDGQPLPEATISFRSTADQFSAETGLDGRYALKLGAVPGEYKVDIGKFAGGETHTLGTDPGMTVMPGEKLPESRPLRQLIPHCYSDPMRTELSFTVSEPGADSADFHLRSR